MAILEERIVRVRRVTDNYDFLCFFIAILGLLMSSTEDIKGGPSPKPSESPDPGLGSSTGPSKEPTTQTHSTVSQQQGDFSHPTNLVKTENGK